MLKCASVFERHLQNVAPAANIRTKKKKFKFYLKFLQGQCRSDDGTICCGLTVDTCQASA